MNDRFKFRFWHKPTQKMIDCYGFNEEFVFGDVLDGIGTEYNPAKFEDCILMQCTGLKDNNGTLIYEGDIIKIPDNWDIYGQFAGEIREVYYNEGFRLKPKWDTKARGNWLEDTKDFEVIGNIYENKELIESEDSNV